MACIDSFIGWRAIGTILSVLDNTVSPQVYHPIVKLDSVPSPQGKTSEIDVTTHDTANNFMQFLASLKDGGTASMTGVWDPTDPSHAQLQYWGVKKAFDDGITRQWKIDYPTSPANQIIFCGFVNAYAVDSKAKDALRFSFGIRVSGQWDLAVGS